MTTDRLEAAADHLRRQAGVYALLALATVLRFFRLGERSLSLDECIMVEVVRSPWPLLVETTNRIHSASPLFPAISKAMTTVLPESEFMFRLPAALFGLIAVWVLVRAAWSRDRAMALFSGLFLAAGTQQLWLSRDYNGYSLLVLAAAACFWAYFRMDRAPRMLPLLAVWEVAAVWAHYQGVFTIGGLQIAYLLEKRFGDRPLPSPLRWIGWHLAALAGVLAVVPVSLLTQWKTNPRGVTYLAAQYFSRTEDGFATFFKRNIREFLDSAFAPHPPWSAYVYALLVGAAAGLLIFRLFRRSPADADGGFPVRPLAFSLAGAGLFYLPFILAGLYPFGGIRHNVFLTIPVYLLCGWFLARLPRPAAFVLLGGLLFFYAPATRAHFDLVLYGGEHIRPLIERLEAAEDNDPVIVYSGAMRAFRYYAPETGREVRYLMARDLREQGASAARASLGAGDAWVIASHFQGNHRDLLDRVLSAPPRATPGRWEEPGAVLWRVRNPPDQAAEVSMTPVEETPETTSGDRP
jgi:hypothetical protein